MEERYLIYKMLGRNVKCIPFGFGENFQGFTGVINEVERCPFEDKVVLTVNNKKHSFNEPASILEDDGNIIFVYRDGEFDDSDETFFSSVRQKAYAGSMRDVINNNPCLSGKVLLQFEVGDLAPQKRRWTRRK